MSRIASGLVRFNRSLLPRTSRFQASKRAPRNSSSSSFRVWIMVPMAPSSSRMRSAASLRSRDSMGEILADTLILMGHLSRLFDTRSPARAACGRPLPDGERGRRAQAQQMADRVDQVGAVHGVEVEIAHPAVDQVE